MSTRHDTNAQVVLDAVVVAVTAESPRILTIQSEDGGDEMLPNAELDPARHDTLERGLRTVVSDQTDLDLGYAEQLYSFGNRFRDPVERSGGPRVVSVAYMALVQETQLRGDRNAAWRDWYAHLPWEDWREGRPDAIDRVLEPSLRQWSRGRRDLNERIDVAFGLRGAPFDPERTLERYELLYEAGTVEEAYRDGLYEEAWTDVPMLGKPLAKDHRRILATALGRLRGKIRYRPVVFELLPECFTLLQLQRVVEALSGNRLHKQNFRRLVDKGGLVEGTGKMETQARGRPAELFQFRRDVLRERPAPGVQFSGAFWGTTG